ncbi:MAG: hypothetical protein ABIG44_13565 [Planctomycetota bacterium]
MSELNEKTPTIIVKAGNPAIPFVISLVIGLGAFWGGTYYERAMHADYSVRVDGVPNTVHVEGAPSRIDISGSVGGIPKEITFRGTALDGILPKEIQVHTAAAVALDTEHAVVVTPQGKIYVIYYSFGWNSKKMN